MNSTFRQGSEADLRVVSIVLVLGYRSEAIDLV
jgi:hypothetical protein